MKPQVQPRDVERLVVAYLTEALEDENCTVGVGVPASWKPTSTPHVEVASDGEPRDGWPIVTYTTIRLVARANGTSAAKALCGLAYGLLCAHNGDEAIVSTRALAGPLPARDPQTNAELASATVRVTARTEPVETGS